MQKVNSSSSSRTSRPNLIMVIMDDFGWADVGYHNSSFSTPTMDELAEQGIKLEKYYVMLSCAPSRSALLTGVQPYKQGMQFMIPGLQGMDVGIPIDVPTIAE